MVNLVVFPFVGDIVLTQDAGEDFQPFIGAAAAFLHWHADGVKLPDDFAADAHAKNEPSSRQQIKEVTCLAVATGWRNGMRYTAVQG